MKHLRLHSAGQTQLIGDIEYQLDNYFALLLLAFFCK